MELRKARLANLSFRERLRKVGLRNLSHREKFRRLECIIFLAESSLVRLVFITFPKQRSSEGRPHNLSR